MPAEFAKLLEKLVEHRVQYLVVGGVATCLNGYVRYTNDLDIIVQANEDNVRRLIEALSLWGNGHARELSIEDFVPAEMGSIRIVEEFALDVFTLMRARETGAELDFEKLREDARVYTSQNGVRIDFISPARLIELKTGTGRGKDLVDTESLREILRGGREVEPVLLEALEPQPPCDETPNASAGGNDEWPLSPTAS